MGPFNHLARISGLKRPRGIDGYLRRQVFRNLDVSNAAILDVGGGNGLISLWAVTEGDAGSALVLEPGLDGSSKQMESQFNSMISILDPETRARLELSTQTIEQLDQATRKFDFVLFHNSINHIDECSTQALHSDPNAQAKYKEVFDRISDLMTESGHLIIADCSNRNAFGDLGLRNPVAPSINWGIHQPPEVWSKVALETGFTETDRLWTSRREFGRLGQVVAGNRPVSYLLNSHFVLHFAKTGAPDPMQDS